MKWKIHSRAIVLISFAAALTLGSGSFAQQPGPQMPPLLPSSPATATTAPAEKLRVFLTQSDHASGIYYAKEEGRFTISVENLGQDTSSLNGEIVFGAVADDGTFKPLSTTPIEPAEIRAQQSVRLTVGGAFGSPGHYELRWNGQPMQNEPGFFLQCIFPPRATLAGPATMPATPGSPPPWVARLPLASRVPGFLADYITRTGIARFVLEDKWPTDPNDDFASLAESTAKAPVEIILRIQLLAPAQRDAHQLTQFHDHVAALLKKFGKSITAIVVEPSPEILKPADATFSSYYLAVYDAAKKHDKNIRMLGPGTLALATTLFPAKPPSGPSLLEYLDAVATTQAPGEMARVHAVGGRFENRPIWVLPQHAGDTPARDIAALALAEGAAMVPVPEDDFGVTGNLFGNSVFFQRVAPELPPTILVFQGNGYCVAAIVGTAADGNGPAPEKPVADDANKKPGTLEVADLNREFRVVDESGRNVDCRFGDLLRIPLDTHVRYLICPDAADDLVAILKQATLHAD